MLAEAGGAGAGAHWCWLELEPGVSRWSWVLGGIGVREE